MSASKPRRAYEYFQAFEQGLSDTEIAEEFDVSPETVARYRHLTKAYDLDELDAMVIGLRRKRAHLSTIFRTVRRDPRFSPYDDAFLLGAICRRIREAGRVISRLELGAVLKRAFGPEAREEAQQRVAAVA